MLKLPFTKYTKKCRSVSLVHAM